MNRGLWKRRWLVSFCSWLLLTAYLSGWTIQAGRLSDGFAAHLMAAALLIVGLVEWRAARLAAAVPAPRQDPAPAAVVTSSTPASTTARR